MHRVGVPGDLGALSRRPRARGREASGRRPAAARPRSTWGRTGRTRSSAAPGTSAPGRRSRWRCRARRSRTGSTLERRKLRGQVSEGMILAEDELDLGTDHSGIIVLDDALEAGHAARRCAAARRRGARPRADREPRRPARRLRCRARGRGALRRRAACRCPDRPAAGRRRAGRDRDRGSGGLPALRRPRSSATSRSASRRCG